jgi:ABC-2 type transport system ATP-binding protein
MRAGTLVAQGSIDEVRRQAGPQEIRVQTPDVDSALALLTGRGLGPRRTGPDEITANAGTEPVEDINAALVRADIPVRGFQVLRADLEDLFVTLTGEGFDVAG